MRGATGQSHRPSSSRRNFNPRSSCEERRSASVSDRRDASDFNPRSSCEERPEEMLKEINASKISIHAPHARSDAAVAVHVHRIADFNPRSSCEERPMQKRGEGEEEQFQSTLLMRGATRCFRPLTQRRLFQSTLLMRGATCSILRRCMHGAISIHAPHARSDGVLKLKRDRSKEFQSTLLMRGATVYDGGRSWLGVFQSTLLMRGATVSILGIDLPDFIIYFSRTYPFSPKMPTSRHLSCKLHFLCDGTSHFGDL